MAGTMSDPFFEDFVRTQFDIASKDLTKKITFTNRGPVRAPIVLSSMILGAKTSIDIYTGFLSSPFYKADDFEKIISRKPEVKIRIICEQDYKECNSTLIKLEGLILDKKIKVRILSEDDDVKITLSKSNLNHFILIDSSNLRVESNHDDQAATILLNDSVIANNYIEIFNNLWNGYCKQI